jgi:hypothetical protein
VRACAIGSEPDRDFRCEPRLPIAASSPWPLTGGRQILPGADAWEKPGSSR